jgi:hypothetical protein
LAEREDLRIVPQELWDKAQQRMTEVKGIFPAKRKGTRPNGRSYVETNPPHLLAGILRCGK